MPLGPYRRSLPPRPRQGGTPANREHPAFIALVAGAGLTALLADLCGVGPLGVASVAGGALIALALHAAVEA